LRFLIIAARDASSTQSTVYKLQFNSVHRTIAENFCYI
jgi:hypothetical protein